MKEENIIVAIDGPAGSGKSTIAKAVAKALDFTLVDTGAIYRSVALLVGQRGISLDDGAALSNIVESLALAFRFDGEINRVFLDGTDVTDAIRTAEVSLTASKVAARPVVRDGLLQLQRRLAGEGGAVLEGRDIGTVVCPHAQVKIFLDASPEERARRRHQELMDAGQQSSYEQVLSEVRARDERDQSRDVAPLRPADDAMRLDSTKLTIDEVLSRVLESVRAVR